MACDVCIIPRNHPSGMEVFNLIETTTRNRVDVEANMRLALSLTQPCTINSATSTDALPFEPSRIPAKFLAKREKITILHMLESKMQIQQSH